MTRQEIQQAQRRLILERVERALTVAIANGASDCELTEMRDHAARLRTMIQINERTDA